MGEMFVVGVVFFSVFLLFRLVQALRHRRRFMAEYESHAGDLPPTIDPENVPPTLRHLVPLLEKWSILDDVERSGMQDMATLDEKRAFIQAVWPHMEEIETWVNKAHETLPVPHEAVAFMFLTEAVAEIKPDLDSRGPFKGGESDD